MAREGSALSESQAGPTRSRNHCSTARSLPSDAHSRCRLHLEHESYSGLASFGAVVGAGAGGFAD